MSDLGLNGFASCHTAKSQLEFMCLHGSLSALRPAEQPRLAAAPHVPAVAGLCSHAGPPCAPGL